MTGSAETRRHEPNAYRRWYSTLHPSLQLIGLQLWLPLFFIVMFCLCYIAAFHQPTPHEVPVGFVSSSQALQNRVGDTLGDAVRIVDFDTVGGAKEAVIRGRVGLAYDGASATIYVASAHQVQLATIMPTLLEPVLAAAGVTATVDNLVPLPAWDEFGTVSLYLTLAWCIGGYMVAMFIGMMGAPLKHRTRLAVIVGGGLIISLVTNLLAGPVIGAVHGHFVVLSLMAWAWIVAIGITVNGLSYFFGRFIAMPALVIFVFLSVPSSGAAFPAWFMPEPFAWLNHVVVGSGITEMLKRELYGVGPGFGRGIVMLVCYAVAGLVLMVVGKRYWEHRRVRRILASRTTIFMDAQNANREFLIEERRKVLDRHGLASSETGTLTVIPGRRREVQGHSGLEDDRPPSDPFFGDGGLEDEETTTRPIELPDIRRDPPTR
ncbi:MAG TPA: ABC transporter permease [Lacisediminihabitans sp.]|uniref:ABC transporter permease n=1 Tax=Lacisediminihabitans sp. TaxID=2787631 RepID=UPI002ED9F056